MTVLRTQLRGISRRPSKLFLTGLGILVASFFAYAIVMAQQVTEATIAERVSETPNGADAVISGEAALMPAAMLDQVARTSGVAEVTGRVNGGVVVGSYQEGRYFAVFADPGSGSLTRTKLTSGTFPDTPGEVAISAKTAERDGMRLGQRVQVRSDNGTEQGGPPITLTVTGVVEKPEDQGMTFVLRDRAAAPLVRDVYSRFDVRFAEGTTPSNAMTALSGLVGRATQGAVLDDAETTRAQEISKNLEEVEPIFALLATFVVIAVIAAALVVTSTFRIMFAQRMRQLALLRAVGAARMRITGALVVEGAITGLVCGVAGVLLALGLGQLTPLGGRAFGMDLPAAGVSAGWAIGIVVGAVIVTVLAVMAPAFTASRVSPLQALRTSATTTSQKSIGVLRALCGAGLIVVAVALGLAARFKVAPLNEDDLLVLLTIVASGTAAFGALLAFGPVIVRPLLKVVAWPVTRLGPVGRLAVGGVGGAPRRAAAVSAVVALGVMLISGVLIGSATLRALATAELSLEYPSDIQVLSVEAGKSLPKDLPERLSQKPELEDVLPYRQIKTTSGEQELPVADLDLGALPAAKEFDLPGGKLSDLGPGKAAVPEVYADMLKVGVGDDITLTAGTRTRTVKVAALLSSAGPLGGPLILDPADVTALDPSAGFSGLLANAKSQDTEDVTEARAAILAEIGNADGITVDTLADARAEIDDLLNTLTGIALALLALTVVIAVSGVGTTTALSVVERTRESGMLRAVGLSKRGLKVSITTEAALYGLVGSVIGLVMAVPYSALMLDAAGIEADVELPVGQIAAMFVVLAGLTALAGLLPARRAAKVSPVAALAHE